jgi:hypothetical protein
LFLTPRHPRHVAGWIVGALGYAAMAWHAVQYRRHRKDETTTSFDRKQMWGMLITFITFSMLAFCPSLEFKSYVCIWLIFSGLSEAWIFLRP